MSQTVTLREGVACATIDALGAELTAWSVANRDLLWRPDPAIWAHTAPVLFPIVGWAQGGHIRVDRNTFPIGVHGFAGSQTFECTELTATSATLTCAETSATLASFPFRFRLAVHYTLGANSLSVQFTIINPGDRDLPYAIGFHPGFAWPLPGNDRERHVVEFSQLESAKVPVITADGLFSNATRPIPLEGRTLPLSDTILKDEALCFLDAKSRVVHYRAPDGSTLEIALEDFPHIALWSVPPAPFISIEAWTGHGDPDGFTGDIREKPSMRLLPPGEAATHAVHLAYRA